MSDSAVLEEAAALAEPAEGFFTHPYRDPVGIWTIGYGSTRDADELPVSAETPPVTHDEAVALLERDMRAALLGVREACAGVALGPLQEAALADFVYNLGIGSFRSSTLLRKLRSGDYAGAAAEFVRWDRAGGRILQGLLKRREAEQADFEKGMNNVETG